MGFPSIEDFEKTEDGLEKRAKKILDIVEGTDINEEKLKKVFRRKAKETHPDMNPENEKATKYFKLVLQAKNYLKGDKRNKKLLKNDELVIDYIDEPVGELNRSYNDLIQAYERWRRNQFYNMENDSIWPK